MSGTVAIALRNTKTSKQFSQSLTFADHTFAAIVLAGLKSLPKQGPLWNRSAGKFRHFLHFFWTLAAQVICSLLHTVCGVEAPRIFIYRGVGARSHPRQVA